MGRLYEGEEEEGGGRDGASGRSTMELGKMMKYTFSVFSGEPLSWGERCRIKHLPTRKYLAVVHSEGEYKVSRMQFISKCKVAKC